MPHGVIPTTWDDPNFLESYVLRKAPETVYVPKGKLANKAKVTDLLNSCFPGLSLNLFVSDLLKDVINTSKHYGMQFFETSLVLNSGKELEYWILHSYEYGYQYLNLNESLIVLLDREDRSKILQKITLKTIRKFKKNTTKYIFGL